MRTLSLPFLHRLSDLAPLALRLGLGIVFTVHGWQKLDGGPATGFGGMLTGLDVPAPEFTAWLVTIAELVGGILLLLGLLTRLATLPLIATMIGAILLVKTDVGIIADPGAGAGAELDIALLAGLVALMLFGPGRVSVDHAMAIEPPARVETARR
ncbi:MAG: DoxX family protein [Ornithinimicrobium sp.]